jgi:hypothetical protein
LVATWHCLMYRETLDKSSFCGRGEF